MVRVDNHRCNASSQIAAAREVNHRRHMMRSNLAPTHYLRIEYSRM